MDPSSFLSSVRFEQILLRNKFYEKNMFHHERAITSLSCKFPAESKFAVEMTVFPVQLFLQLVSSPLAEADHRPHGAAQGAAAAETPKQQPPHIDGQSFPESHVDPGDGRLELFRGHSGV